MGQDGVGLVGTSVPSAVPPLPQDECNASKEGKPRSDGTELEQFQQASPESESEDDEAIESGSNNGIREKATKCDLNDEAIESGSRKDTGCKATKSDLNPCAVEIVPTMGQNGEGLTGASVPSYVQFLPQNECSDYEKGETRSCGAGLGRTTLLVSLEAEVQEVVPRRPWKTSRRMATTPWECTMIAMSVVITKRMK